MVDNVLYACGNILKYDQLELKLLVNESMSQSTENE